MIKPHQQVVVLHPHPPLLPSFSQTNYKLDQSLPTWPKLNVTMGMKVKLIPKDYWPSCSHSPKTLSFRHSDVVFKTLNSVYFDSAASSDHAEDDGNDEDDDVIESLVRGAHSGTRRLFFEPSTNKAILAEEEEEEGEVGRGPLKESVVMAMESEDPYVDFRRSMQEMVEAHGLLKDWASLEELLAWYLQVNTSNNHAYIVAAFVDLLLKLSSSSSSSSSNSSSSNLNAVSSTSTSRSSSSCACARCRDELLMGIRRNSKSTTSFSSAASSFSSIG